VHKSKRRGEGRRDRKPSLLPKGAHPKKLKKKKKKKKKKKRSEILSLRPAWLHFT
jgi:hypothetical protein